MKGKKLITILNDSEILLISKIQRFTYRCIKMFNTKYTESNKGIEEKERLIHMWTQRIFTTGDKFEIIFDDILWSTDKESDIKGNIVKLRIKNTDGLNYTTIVDFRKDLFDCSTLIRPNGEILKDINIFNVEYKLN